MILFIKQKTAYEMRISDWSSDVCSSDLLKLRSVSSIVMAAARTGSANNSMKAVTRMAQTNSGILWSVMPGARMFKMVVMKLMAPRMEDAPARCIESITMSTAGPGDPLVESGG